MHACGGESSAFILMCKAALPVVSLGGSLLWLALPTSKQRATNRPASSSGSHVRFLENSSTAVFITGSPRRATSCSAASSRSACMVRPMRCSSEAAAQLCRGSAGARVLRRALALTQSDGGWCTGICAAARKVVGPLVGAMLPLHAWQPHATSNQRAHLGSHEHIGLLGTLEL